MNDPDYVAIGHVTIDLLDARRSLGGGVVYAGLTAEKLGATVGVLTSATSEVSLPFRFVQSVPAAATTTLEIVYDPSGRRSQRLVHRAGSIRVRDLPSAWSAARVVHLAPECGEIDAGFLDAFPRSFVGVTPQGWLRRWDRDGHISYGGFEASERLLECADAIVLSEEDADADTLAIWAKRAAILVVTRGAFGCDVVMRGSAPRHIAGFESDRTVDATGCGDVFAAAFFWQLANGSDVYGAARWASCMASFVVEKFGTEGIPDATSVERRLGVRAEKT